MLAKVNILRTINSLNGIINQNEIKIHFRVSDAHWVHDDELEKQEEVENDVDDGYDCDDDGRPSIPGIATRKVKQTCLKAGIRESAGLNVNKRKQKPKK